MKFAAFGRTHILFNTVQECVAHGHQVVLIGTCPAAPEYTVTEKGFEQLANDLGCPFFNDPAINRPEYLQLVKESAADVAISLNWMTLIGQGMIDQFRYGIINAHAGDLPRYRGNAVPNWAILAGEDKIVLTLHQMTVDLDAGPIFMQEEYPLTPATHIGDIYRFLGSAVPRMFLELLDGLEKGSITPRPQPDDPSLSLRCFPRLPRDGEIDWHASADHLARLVHASSEPFAGAYTYMDGEKVIVWRAHPELLPFPYVGMPGQVVEVRKDKGEVAVLAEAGILVLEEVETNTAGRRKAAGQITSTRIRLGMDMAYEISKLKDQIRNLEKRTGHG